MEEEDQKKKKSSLPPNYVSLVQLQERWIKEQQRKQKQKEEQEERKRREIEEEQTRKHEKSNHQNRNEDGLRAEVSTVSSTYRPFLKNRRNLSEKNRRSSEVNESKSDDLRIEDAVVCDEEQKTDESEKKMKWRKKSKPKVQENLNGGEVQVSSENVPGQEIPVVVTVRNEEKNDVIGEYRQKGDYMGLNNEVQEQRVSGDQTVEIGRNFECLTLNGENTSNMRSLTEINGRNWRYKGGSGRFGGREMYKQRDGNFVWVKKGEISDPNASEIRRSDSIMEAGEGKKKSAVVWKQKEMNWRQ